MRHQFFFPCDFTICWTLPFFNEALISHQFSSILLFARGYDIFICCILPLTYFNGFEDHYFICCLYEVFVVCFVFLSFTFRSEQSKLWSDICICFRWFISTTESSVASYNVVLGMLRGRPYVQSPVWKHVLVIKNSSSWTV